MTEDTMENSSYLDLEDPFHTTNSTETNNTKPNIIQGAVGDIEKNVLGNDVTDSTHQSPTHSQAPSLVEVEITTHHKPQRHSSIFREIINSPSQWNIQANQRNSLSQVDTELKVRTENVLNTDIDVLTKEQLCTLITVAARLLIEHDALHNNREKLLEVLKTMYATEFDVARELIKMLNIDTVDEASRNIIQELSNKVSGPSSTKIAEKIFIEEDREVVTPSSTSSETMAFHEEVPKEHSPPSHLFSVPPPDPTRPPPGFAHEQSVPDLSTMQTTTIDTSTPPPLIIKRLQHNKPLPEVSPTFFPAIQNTRIPSMLNRNSTASAPTFTITPPLLIMPPPPIHQYQYLSPHSRNRLNYWASGLSHSAPPGNTNYRRRFPSRGRGGTSLRK